MENIVLLILGVVLVVIGVVNMTGNISTIHSYNRRRVSEADVPKYGKAVGIGTIVIGASMMISGVLVMLNAEAAMPFVAVPAIIVGIGFILFAQFKYNKGIF